MGNESVDKALSCGTSSRLRGNAGDLGCGPFNNQRSVMEQLAHTVDPFISLLGIFVLAVFVGYYVVWNVTPALHTPLMSVTNAISSVIIVGALLAVGAGAIASGSTIAMIFGFLALVLASINIFGGFMVTSRMLAMYKKKAK
jgi:H+-translocating NAD(P) transhydrogenase subunit alpha